MNLPLFCPNFYFMKYFVKYFWNISKISRWIMRAGCTVHCNKVSKPVKSRYLLSYMNSIMYFLLTSYTLIMFVKVLSHFIMKIKNFVKYFKEGVLKYFKMSMKFLNIWKWNISSCISNCNAHDWHNIARVIPITENNVCGRRRHWHRQTWPVL